MAISRTFKTGNARMGTAAVILAAALIGCAAAPALGQGRLDAKYEASLAGIPVGKGTWTIDIADDQYTANMSGGSSGLLNAFAGGSGRALAQGRVVAGAISPLSYAASTSSSKKTETIRMTLSGGVVKEAVIEPEPPIDTNRILVTDAHRRGVFDPMTGALLKVPGTGDPVTAEACQASTPVFDGRMRYNLKLDFKRMATVRAENGYRGPAVVCAIYFEPVAGYIPDRASIKYLAAQRNMEAWFAPIAGTRFLVPFRVTVPTPLGTAMLEATQFITAPRAALRTQ
jgi:hypothetical protein